jgi:nucleotide-binding universal stress UspA family protein
MAESSMDAVDHAVSISRKEGAPLIALHVIYSPTVINELALISMDAAAITIR